MSRRDQEGASAPQKKRRPLRRILTVLLVLSVVGSLVLFGINGYVKLSTKALLLTAEQAAELNADCILVLGAGVSGDRPSALLNDRIRCGIELYELGAAPKLLMSGDHGQYNYDEVNVMKNYAVAAGVPESDVFMDHAGFSTYESLYRAKEVFGVRTVVIVSQEYHLYRALNIARSLELEAYGVAAEDIAYSGQFYRESREILARNKDFVYCIFKPKPTYLGEPIPISGDGALTDG